MTQRFWLGCARGDGQTCRDQVSHASLNNVTPGDVSFGRMEQALARRRAPQIRTPVARRGHYRRMVSNRLTEESGKLRVQLRNKGPSCLSFTDGLHTGTKGFGLTSE